MGGGTGVTAKIPPIEEGDDLISSPSGEKLHHPRSYGVRASH